MKLLLSLFLFLFLLPFGHTLLACSVYKITLKGKTFVGNNEDYWNPNTRMWFEKGANGNYGSMYVGFDNFYPQGGMNEKGLTFDGFSVDGRQMKPKPNKQAPGNDLIKIVMQKCQNVDEAYRTLEKYDLTTMLNSSMLMFIDAEGNYLVVEGDALTKGKDSKYLLSNFCPSQTPDPNKVDIEFYQKGRKLMNSKVDTTLSYLTALSDTLHQSFPQDMGGTLYTTIYDLNEKLVHLYYYHDYSKRVTINLAEELKKPDAVLNIPDLFPQSTAGKENILKINKGKDFVKALANPALSGDFDRIKQEIRARDVSTILGLFESDLNTLGYELLKEKDKNPAINVFRLNVANFPNSWNAHDSLGDAYFEDKKNELAMASYRKSLELNPNNQNAVNQLKKLDH